MNTKKRTPAMLLLIASLWIGGIGAGSFLMLEHEFTAGETGAAPPQIPDVLRALTAQEKPLTLFIAVHPDCPCTGASLEQLDRLLARNSDAIQVVALVKANEGEKENSAYWNRLAALPNAHPIADPEGYLAKRLGIHVSGAIVGYDDSGVLRYQGGITASRGHSGPSRSMDSIEAIARQLAPLELCSMPAFGCDLEDDLKRL